jgi:hypothetical protein
MHAIFTTNFLVTAIIYGCKFLVTFTVGVYAINNPCVTLSLKRNKLECLSLAPFLANLIFACITILVIVRRYIF